MSSCDFIPDTNQFLSWMDQETKQKKIPLSGTFELTPRCNFDCKMCYVHLMKDKISNFGRELTADEWIDLAMKARDAGMLQLCITGGEPLLHPEFTKIYKELAQMGFLITLQTNASTISDEMVELFTEFPPQEVKITIYGSNDEVYEKVCGIQNGFSRVDEGIHKLLDLKIPMLLVTTIIQQNKDDLIPIAKYVQGLKVPWIYTSSVHPSIRGADTDITHVAIDEESATDYREDVRRMIQFPAMKDDKKPCEYCKGHHNSFWITWNGKMQFCSFMNEPKISVLDLGFDQAWKQLIQYEEELQWPKECQVCEIRHICRRCIGMIAAKSGSADRVDPVYCEKMKRYVREEMERSHEV